MITYARSHKAEKRISLRSQLVIDWMEGLSYKESSAKNNVSEMVISKWRKRFKNNGLRGLQDEQRSGKPISIDEITRNKIIHLACSKPSDGRRRYSQTDIAKKTGVSQSMVSEILRDNKLKPHKRNIGAGKALIRNSKKDDIHCGALFKFTTKCPGAIC